MVDEGPEPQGRMPVVHIKEEFGPGNWSVVYDKETGMTLELLGTSIAETNLFTPIPEPSVAVAALLIFVILWFLGRAEMKPEIAESPLFQGGIACFCAGLFCVVIWGFYLPDAPEAIWVGLICILAGFFLMLVLAVRAKERFGG